MKKILAFGLLGVLIVLALFGRTLAASDQIYSVNSSYKIAANGSGSISHTIDAAAGATNPETLKIPVAGVDQNSITARFGETEATAKLSDDHTSIVVTVPASASAADGWRMTLSYKANLLRDLGGVKGVQVPALEGIGLDISSQKTVVSADIAVGLASALPTPDKTDISIGEQIFTYENKTGPVSDAVTLLFNDETSVIIDMTSKLENSRWWWSTVELTLPPDTNQQQVILESLEPAPSNVRLDQDGNILAQYTLGPRGSLDVTSKLAINIRNVNYDLKSSANLQEVPDAIKNHYTSQTNKWFGGQIEINVNPAASAAEVVNTIYEAVVSHAKSETFTSKNNDFSGTLLEPEKYANLLIGELRAKGVPARAVLGKIITDGQFIMENSVNHTWVEAYLPSVGWITLDPSFAVYGDYFGKSDVMHVGLVLWGVSDDAPPVNLDESSVTYVEEHAEARNTVPALSATKYMILPGFSMMSVGIDMPPGVITDGNAVAYGQTLYQLGSLAPLQKANSKSFAFGSNSFSDEEVKYGYTDGETLVTELAVTQSSLNYIPMIVILLGIIGLIVMLIMMRRRRDSKKYKPSKDSVILHDEDHGGDVENIDLVKNKDFEEKKVTKPDASTTKPASASAKPAVTRGTIDSSNNGVGFQGPSKENPRRHIIQ